MVITEADAELILEWSDWMQRESGASPDEEDLIKRIEATFPELKERRFVAAKERKEALLASFRGMYGTN